MRARPRVQARKPGRARRSRQTTTDEFWSDTPNNDIRRLTNFYGSIAQPTSPRDRLVDRPTNLLSPVSYPTLAMSLAFTFGSFGDILALTGLVVTVVQALRDSTGSASEYKDLIAELDALSSTLGLVQSRFTSQHRPRKDVVNAIDLQVSCCHSVIKKFLESVKGYEKALGSAGFHSSLRKIGWKIFKSDDVTALRAKITSHREAIAILLSLYISCVQFLFTHNRPHQAPPVTPHAAIKLTVRVQWDTRLRTQCG